MFNEHVMARPVNIDGVRLEVVQEYVYLGQKIQVGRHNFEGEANKRIQLGWAAFSKLRQVFSSTIPQCLKTKVFEQCILPVQTYGAETWTLTVGLVHKFHIAQRAMERAMLGISLMDKIRNEDIGKRTKVTDIVRKIRKLKWQWAVTSAAGPMADGADQSWSGDRALQPDGPTTCARSRVGAGKQRTGMSGAVLGRPTSSSGLRMADDDERRYL
ncbi:hypothetical protein K1T71_013212 [Dendrolimus kikuchii]|uniref:Uncharacterized protein n=1 Tax=Dendrolimus kikuchii TaxID=765133 RepID=A0ACC1CHK5_9NEOP|nr:hypothetical protein K1T71_013212 [Dendrolimus kikuchii]